jgi:biotin carboxyl carrier protein
MEAVLTQGETLTVLERVVVAPSTGVFRLLPPATVTAEGELVTEGQQIGVIEGPGVVEPVHSAFSGWLMGMLAHPGERVREGQPVAWLRSL